MIKKGNVILNIIDAMLSLTETVMIFNFAAITPISVNKPNIEICTSITLKYISSIFIKQNY
jgi:hypothetical protein